MIWLRRLQLRIRSILRRERLETELDQELEFHLAEQKAEYLSQGMSETEADLAARRAFGATVPLAEQCRDERGTQWLDDFAGDTRFAVRTLLRSPGFTWAAVATLALGLGANLAFFSATYRVLYRALPYTDPDRLVEIDGGVIGGVGPTTALRELASEADYAGYLPNVESNVQLAGEAVRLHVASVTWNLARVLGVRPIVGRWFEPREERAGQHRVTVVSDRMWRERLGADPNVLGRRIVLNEEPYEILGVMPASFAFPSAGTELWTPIHVDPASRGYMWGNLNLWPIGRLRKDVTVAAAQAELGPIVDRIRPMFPWRMPDEWGRNPTLVLHSQALVKDSRSKLFALAAASLLLLVIACGNVANLLLTRWIRRAGEFSVREALGAGRGRLTRQLVTENLLLAVAGGIAGLAAAYSLLRALPLLLDDMPRMNELSIEPNAAIAAAGTMLVTFALLSIIPMLRSKMLQGSSGRLTATKRSSRISLSLAGLQLALATSLLVGAGLMGRTLWQLGNVDSGVRAAEIVTGLISAGPSRCATADLCRAFLQDLNATLAGVPGVRGVNWSNGTPLIKKISAMSVDIEDHPREAVAPAFVLWHTIATPGYFGALGIQLRTGRLFSETDRASSLPVAMISESTARKFWPTESPIGKLIRPVAGKIGRTVVGVVADVAHYSLDGFPSWIDGVQYVPLEQALPQSAEAVQLSIFVEAAPLPQGALQSAIRQRYPDVVISGVTSLQRVRAASVSGRRSIAWLLSLLAGLGLLLGIVGVYGVLTQRAAQRTREIGVRIALGATTGQIAGVVLREALLVAVAGSGAGVLAAFGLSRFLRSLLFGVAEHDAVAFLGAPAILIATALLAATIPGLRASRVDPVTTLRAE